MQTKPIETFPEPCERCQGNGEIITNWERYMAQTSDEPADAWVAECPDCDGIGHAYQHAAE